MLEKLISVSLLDVRYCPKLQFYAILKKTNNANLRKLQKTKYRTQFRSTKTFFVSFTPISS